MTGRKQSSNQKVEGPNPSGPTFFYKFMSKNKINISRCDLMIFTKEIKISKINKNEKDWLIGLFLADGTKYKDLRTYRVTFYLNSLKDYKILEKLELILKKIRCKL